MKIGGDGIAVAAVAVVLLLVTGAWVAQSGRVGPPPAVDFVHFYTLGHAAAHTADREALSSEESWAGLIARIAPGRDEYPRVYGPHVALLFAPFSFLPLFQAYLVWNLLSLVGFTYCAMWLVMRHARPLRPFHLRVTAGILSCPAFVYVLILGHASVIAVAALTLLTLGLARRSSWVAGIGLALLSFKPTLFLPAIGVALVAGYPLVVAVALGLAAGSLLLTIPWLGLAPIAAYAATLVSLGQAPDAVANPALMSSLRTFWYQLLPPAVALACYALTGGAAIVAAGWGWRRTNDPLQRAGLTGVAIVLSAPHLYYYDLVIAVPAAIASAAWLTVGPRPGGSVLRALTWAAYLAPLAAPVALMTPVHVPAAVHAAWFVALVWHWAVRKIPRQVVAA